MPDPVYGFNLNDAENLIRVLGENGGTAKGPPPSPDTPHAIIVLTPGGGVAARSGTSPGSATVDVYEIDGGTLTDTTLDVTVYNLSTTAVPGSCYFLARRVRFTPDWIIDPPAVTDIRVDGTDLELRRNCDWSVWHAGEDCEAT